MDESHEDRFDRGAVALARSGQVPTTESDGCDTVCESRPLKVLTPEQERQIAKHCRAHRHHSYNVDLRLSYGETLPRFAVHAGVMRPERMTSIILARFLYSINGLYRSRDCVDMGCGSGVQGIVMARGGARGVVFTDISARAVANTKVNVGRFGLAGCGQVLQGDLFERITDDYDVIVFNHPFFVGRPSRALQEQLSGTLAKGAFVHDALSDTGLIHRFLEQARKVLREAGLIIMPYFGPAGEANDPTIQAPKHGYRVSEHFRANVNSGLQQGPVSIYTLSPISRRSTIV